MQFRRRTPCVAWATPAHPASLCPSLYGLGYDLSPGIRRASRQVLRLHGYTAPLLSLCEPRAKAADIAHNDRGCIKDALRY